MSFQQPQHCFSCKRELEQTHVCVPDGEDIYDHLIAQAVWVSPRDRKIGFCNRCYDRQLFAGLHPDEIAALHWSFGRCEAEDSSEIIEKKTRRLLLAAEGLPCGEVFCALAYACDLAGRRTDAREWAAKAVSWAGTYPGKQVAEEILRGE
jgi:hypothetical protein